MWERLQRVAMEPSLLDVWMFLSAFYKFLFSKKKKEKLEIIDVIQIEQKLKS